MVSYNGLLYQFTSDHAAGAWDEGEVVNMSLLKDSEYIKIYSYIISSNIEKLFSRKRRYIQENGSISLANTANYNATTYIPIGILKNVVFEVSGNNTGKTLSLFNKDKESIYSNNIYNGVVEIIFNDIISQHQEAVYAVIADTGSLKNVSVKYVNETELNIENIFKSLNTINAELNSVSSEIPDIDAKSQAAYELITKDTTVSYWNKIDDTDNPWANNILSAVPTVQKIDDALSDTIVYGFIIKSNHSNVDEAIYIRLCTIDTEDIEENTIFTPYFSATQKYSTSDTGQTYKTIIFDAPVKIKENSYLWIRRAGTIDGGSASANGEACVSFYTKNDSTIYKLKYSASPFTKIDNATTGVGLIKSVTSVAKNIKDLQESVSVQNQILTKDLDLGVSVYTKSGFIGSTEDAGTKNFVHSDYIDITNVQRISFATSYDSTHFTGAVFYNEDKNYLGVEGAGNENNHHYYRDFEIASKYPTAKYVIFCAPTSFISAIGYGVVLKYSKKENDIINDSYLSTINKGVQLYLPNRVYCLVGRTLQIFKRSILYASNIDNFIVDVKVISGNNRFTKYPNFIEFSPLSGDGEISAQIVIANNLGDVMFSRDVTFVAVETPVSPENEKNILFIGDSWTQAIYPEEVARMLCGISYSQPSDANFPTSLNLTNINFIGTNNNEAYTSETYREGASGKTLEYHLGEQSPFYDSSKGDIDFTTYINSGNVKGSIKNPVSGDKIDVIILLHGRNSMPTLEQISHLIEKAKEHNPKVKILIGINLIGATLNNTKCAGGITQYNAEELIDTFICKKQDNVYPLQIDLGLDTRYNMINQEISVNYRNTKYKEICNNFSNIFHPNDNGYLQIADEVLYELCYVLNSI